MLPVLTFWKIPPQEQSKREEMQINAKQVRFIRGSSRLGDEVKSIFAVCYHKTAHFEEGHGVMLSPDPVPLEDRQG